MYDSRDNVMDENVQVKLETEIHIKMEDCDEDDQLEVRSENPVFVEAAPLCVKTKIDDSEESSVDFSCSICDRLLNKSMPMLIWKESGDVNTVKIFCDECNNIEYPVTNICDTTFGSKLKLKQYFRKNEFTCNECNSLFLNKEFLNKHIVVNHPMTNLYSCNQCVSAFFTKHKLDIHINAIHRIKWEIFEEAFQNQADFKRHIDNVHLNMRSLKDEYKDDQVLNSEIALFAEPGPSCINSEIVDSEESIIAEANGKRLDFSCGICNRLINKNPPMHIWMEYRGDNTVEMLCENCNNMKYPICYICNTPFFSKLMLKEHFRMCHSGRKHEFACNECNSVFLSQELLNKHVDVIRRMTMQCVSALVTKQQLDIRMNLAHRIKCGICEEAFQNKADLKRHVDNVHLKKRDFKCEGCKIAFFKVYANSVHSKMKSATCKKCKRVFL